jgi:hypothetical protein
VEGILALNLEKQKKAEKQKKYRAELTQQIAEREKVTFCILLCSMYQKCTRYGTCLFLGTGKRKVSGSVERACDI